MRRSIPSAAALVALLAMGACRPYVEQPVPVRGARAEYLREARGKQPAMLLQSWEAAALDALAAPPAVRHPFRETVDLDAPRRSAVAYRVELKKHETLDISIEAPALKRGGVLIELLEIRGDEAPLRHVASARRGDSRLRARAPRAGAYLVRIQPEIDYGGLYRIAIGGAAGAGGAAPAESAEGTSSITFPVQGRDVRAIASGFGDARDGGERSHRGVDIMAPRGTPALAAADGIVRDVASTPIGGKVVWLEGDANGLSYYYAHLDEQLVRRGQRVRAGDPVGRVGNTGNASGSSPHLHFGVYLGRDRAIDPAGMLGGPATIRLAGVAADRSDARIDVGSLGSWRRSAAGLHLRTSPDLAAAIAAELPRHTPVRLLGAGTGWYRVLLADGTLGFVGAGELEPADSAVTRRRIGHEALLREDLGEGAAAVGVLRQGAEVEVLGAYGDHLFVRSAEGRTGWIGTN